MIKPESPCRKKPGLTEAREFWAKRYGREVTEAGVEEINWNLTAYFNILAQWDREDKTKNLAAAGQVEGIHSNGLSDASKLVRSHPYRPSFAVANPT